MAVSARQDALTATKQAGTRGSRVARLSLLLEENGTVVVVVAAFAAVLITHLRTALAADGWMALLSGRVVAEHGLPSHDTLTIWAHGRTWVDQQWLAQLVLYELERLGGLPLVLLVHAALVTLGLGAAAVLARRLGGSARSTTWVALPVLVAFWPGAAVMRPQSFAYVLFVGVLWLLLDDLRSPSRRVYLALPLLVLWANLHGSVIVGAALVAGYGLIELAGSLWAKPRTVHARSLVLLLAPWLCMLASPYATSLPHYYRTIFSSNFGSYVMRGLANGCNQRLRFLPRAHSNLGEAAADVVERRIHNQLCGGKMNLRTGRQVHCGLTNIGNHSDDCSPLRFPNRLNVFSDGFLTGPESPCC